MNASTNRKERHGNWRPVHPESYYIVIPELITRRTKCALTYFTFVVQPYQCLPPSRHFSHNARIHVDVQPSTFSCDGLPRIK